MLVGTAISGLPVSPPPPLGRTPSIPATTTRTRAAWSSAHLLRIRCSPATPTSYCLSTRLPKKSAVTAAPSATHDGAPQHVVLSGPIDLRNGAIHLFAGPRGQEAAVLTE